MSRLLTNAEIGPDFLRLAEMTTEAYCVANGLPRERKYSDAELQPYMDGVKKASTLLYGEDAANGR